MQNLAETRFKEWLEYKQYPYIYIAQDPQAFSTFFKNFNVKRPDFLILVPGLSIIAVDVKDRNLYSQHESFIIDEERDLNKLLAFERIFRIPVWLAISNQEVAYRTWYWISITEVFEKIPSKVSSHDNRNFRPIPITMCKALSWEDTFSKLFQF